MASSWINDKSKYGSSKIVQYDHRKGWNALAIKKLKNDKNTGGGEYAKD